MLATLLVASGAIYPSDHWDHATKLTTKNFDGSEDGTWVAFYPTNGQFFRASHTKNGGTEVTARLLGKLGVKAAELEVVDWEEEVEGDEISGKGMDREKIKKDVISFLKSSGWSQ